MLPDRICVVGLGYIGLPTAAMFASHGQQVVGVDVNEQVVETLKRGHIHIEEPGLGDLVREAVASGSLRPQTTPAEADAFILAVPTPSDENNVPDLRYVHSAARSIIPYLRQGDLVILESTSPPQTTLGLIPILEESGLRVGTDILLAHSPERVLPGRILTELVENDRVIGGQTPEAAEATARLYRTFVTGSMHLTDATTAELAKLMENTYRDVNIALANEFSRIGHRLGINTHEAIQLANHHPRVNILQPGPGVGGHCIAVDPWFIVDAAPQESELIRTARTINDEQPDFVVRLILDAVADVEHPTIALLGLAYKPDVDDLRGSASIEVARRLRDQGVRIKLHDSHARGPVDGLPLESDLEATLDGADACVILTDHAEYRSLEPTSPDLARMTRKILIDTRNCFDRSDWSAAGFRMHQLGVGSPTGALV